VKSIVVFESGSGSTFEYLVKELPKYDVWVAGLVVSRPGIGALARAEKFKVPALVSNSDPEILAQLGHWRPDLLVLAGYLKKISSTLIADWEGRIINVHPSLLPQFGGQGFYGRKVHEAVWQSGQTFTGATVHFVNSEYDKGSIIRQKKVPVPKGSTVESIEASVQAIEKALLVDVVVDLLSRTGR